MKTTQKVTMTDDGGHFWIDGKLYKAKRYLRTDLPSIMKGLHRLEYVQVDSKEYDARIEKLVSKITSYPGVDLKDVLRDALYDMNLDHLDRLEKMLTKEDNVAEETANKPRVETKRGERGTCVELRIGNRFGAQLRI